MVKSRLTRLPEKWSPRSNKSGHAIYRELCVTEMERERKNQSTKAAATMIRLVATNFSSSVGIEINCSRMCEAIDIENKAISALCRPGRQIKKLKTENTAATAAQSKYQIPLGPWSM